MSTLQGILWINFYFCCRKPSMLYLGFYVLFINELIYLFVFYS